MVEFECGMCKKSFWLSLTPWIPPARRTIRQDPPRGGLRPPKHLCIRHPVSSEATGRRDGAPSQRKHASRQPGHPPRRRSPFPSVSSSSSSSVSCGFPRLLRLLLQPGDRLPDLLLRAAFRQPFDRVQVSENRIQPELPFRRRLRGFRLLRPASFRLRPALPGSPPGSGSGRTTGFPPSVFRFTTRIRPPVPFVCRSSGSWFVSQVRFVFSSVDLGFRSSRLILFVSACFRSVFCLVCLFRFELILRVIPAHRRFIYIILAYIIHYRE